MLRIVGFDHVVLNVADTRRSVDWYGGKLGLEVLRFDEWERQEVFFVSVRINAETIIDLFETPRTGMNADHLCLVVADDVDLPALAASGEFDVVDGPDTRWGAQGDALSLYVRDPDGNVVELRNYAAV